MTVPFTRFLCHWTFFFYSIYSQVPDPVCSFMSFNIAEIDLDLEFTLRFNSLNDDGVLAFL